MYDFLLAEKQKKSGEHFSYTLLGIWVGVCGGGRGGLSHMACIHVRFSFLFVICQCLRCPTHPPMNCFY